MSIPRNRSTPAVRTLAGLDVAPVGPPAASIKTQSGYTPSRSGFVEDRTMWKSFFVAIGVYLFLLGAQCLVCERFVWRASGPPPAPVAAGVDVKPAPPPRGWAPTDPMPWTLMASGIVVCIYSFAIPRKLKKQ
jgi:hypothetical protein